MKQHKCQKMQRGENRENKVKNVRLAQLLLEFFFFQAKKLATKQPNNIKNIPWTRREL